MILYILIIIFGIAIGTIITTISNITNKKDDEKQYLEEYKKIIKECLKYEGNNSENTVKKRNPNKIRKIITNRRRC